MEYSKYLGVGEECCSSESGWTMYIVSPMHKTSYNQYHGYDHDHGQGHVVDGVDESYGDYSIYHNDQDSDDSMVSDASTRPSCQAILRASSKKRNGLSRESKHAVNQKQAEKKLYERRQTAVKEEEQKTRIDAKARKTN